MSVQEPPSQLAKLLRARQGVHIGSIFVFIFCLGFTVMMPFWQAHRDSLGCDALCIGSLTSTRSALTLIGSVVIGRLSDQIGRRVAFWLGFVGVLASSCISLAMPSLLGLWLSVVPSALLNQNGSVMKALFVDYYADVGADQEAERAGAVGRLGMAFGFAMVVGNGFASIFLSGLEYWAVQCVSLMIVCFSALFLWFLPVPPTPQKVTDDSAGAGWRSVVQTMVSLPVLRTPGAQLLVFLRISMGMAFWIFYAIWQVIQKERFNFGPAEHGKFMAFIGLAFAASQGLVAKPLIHIFSHMREGQSILMCICMVVLGAGRLAAVFSPSILCMYMSFAFPIIALGVVNIQIASEAARLSGGSGESGGLYGVLEACESIAGMVGPTLGGVLARMEDSHGIPNLVIYIVLSIYALNAAAVLMRYRYLLASSGEELSTSHGKLE